MAYRPGQYVKDFFKSGGFSLTDKSPNYGKGKIPLFKSLRNLPRKELLYAVGYNLSTLGAFGVDFAALGSVPYLIGQYSNNLNALKKNLRNPSNVLGGQILSRQKLLGAAKVIGKVRPQVTSALRTNTPIDRATNIVIGRETSALLKQARSVGSGGIVMSLIQEINPSRMDNTLLNQAQIPGKGNVFIAWRNRTFADAYTHAPNPFTDNPIMQVMSRDKNRKKVASNIRQGKKGRKIFEGITFEQPSELPISIDKVLSKMGIADTDILDKGMGGTQKRLANVLDNAIANHKYQDDARIMTLPQKARTEMMREAEYNKVNQLIAFTQTRNYKELGSQGTLVAPRNPKVTETDPSTGVRKATKEDNININTITGGVTTSEMRKQQALLRNNFLASLKQDAGRNGAAPTQLFLNDDGLKELQRFLQAFGHMASEQVLKGVKGPANAARYLSQAILTINADVIGKEIVGRATEREAIKRFSKWLVNNGYQETGGILGSMINFDRGRSEISKGAFAIRTSEAVTINSFNKADQIAKYIVGTPNVTEARFRPASGPFYESEYLREVTMNANKHKGVKGLRMHSTKSGVVTEGMVNNIYHAGKAASPTTMGLGHSIGYIDIVTGKVPGISVSFDSKGNPKVATNQKFKNQIGGTSRAFANEGDTLYGKDVSWWDKKIKSLHNNYSKVARTTQTHALLNAAIKSRGSKKQGGNKLFRDAEKEIAKLLVGMQDDDLLEYVFGTFDYTINGKSGKKTIEKRGLSTFSNPAFDSTAKKKGGRSQKMRTSHNYVPTRIQIQKSIHMHRMERKGKNENDGTDYLFRYQVSAGGISPKSKKADGIRDIFSIEFGGPAHDRNMTLDQRTDGMFYLASNFMGKAGTRAAAFFGIFDTGGGSFTATAAGKTGTFKMVSSVEGVYQIRSPYDIGSSDKAGVKVRRNLKREEQQLKKTRKDGVRRILQMEKDFKGLIQNKKGTIRGSDHANEARIAMGRSLALFRQSGAVGTVRAEDVFRMMDNNQKRDLGIDGPMIDRETGNIIMKDTDIDGAGRSIANFAEVNQSSVGYYGKRERVQLGELSGQQTTPDTLYQHGSGKSPGVTKFYGTFYQNMANGSMASGEMPVLNLNEGDMKNMVNIFKNPFTGKIDYRQASKFTGIEPQAIRALGTRNEGDRIFLEKFGFDLSMNLNPADDPKIKAILEDSWEGFVKAFNLAKAHGGPFRGPRGGYIALNDPRHPINEYKRIFLGKDFIHGLNYELQRIMTQRLTPLMNSVDTQTKSIIEKAISEVARKETLKFQNRHNSIFFKNINGLDSSEGQFRQLLQSQAYSVERAKINAATATQFIAKRYADKKRVDKDVIKQFYNANAEKINWEDVHSVNIVYSVEDAAYKAHIIEEDFETGRRKVITENKFVYDSIDGTSRPFTQLESDLQDYYDPGVQAFRDFATDPMRGAEKIVSTKQGSIGAVHNAQQLRDRLLADDTLMDLYVGRHGADVIDDFINASSGGELRDKLTSSVQGAAAAYVDDLTIKTVNTTAPQYGKSYIEELGVKNATRAKLLEQGNKRIMRVISNSESMQPFYLGQLFWQGRRNVKGKPLNAVNQLAIILHNGTRTGYFRNDYDRALFLKGVYHYSMSTPMQKSGIAGDGVKWIYGVTPKNLDGIRTQENIPESFKLIEGAFSLFPSFNLNKKMVKSNTIKDVTFMSLTDYKKLQKEIMDATPTAALGLSDGGGVIFKDSDGNPMFKITPSW
tara:strand:+ start:2357 stop:7546 length:5190 start_codon:yes stop_codon:yes gene_type:complete